MRTILSYADGREIVLRRRRGGCPIVDLEKEARKGLHTLVVEDDGDGPQLIALIWKNAKPLVSRDPFLAGGQVFEESQNRKGER